MSFVWNLNGHFLEILIKNFHDTDDRDAEKNNKHQQAINNKLITHLRFFLLCSSEIYTPIPFRHLQV